MFVAGATGVIVAYAQSNGAPIWLAMGYIAFNSARISVVIWLADNWTQLPPQTERLALSRRGRPQAVRYPPRLLWRAAFRSLC